MYLLIFLSFILKRYMTKRLGGLCFIANLSTIFFYIIIIHIIHMSFYFEKLIYIYFPSISKPLLLARTVIATSVLAYLRMAMYFVAFVTILDAFIIP